MVAFYPSYSVPVIPRLPGKRIRRPVHGITAQPKLRCSKHTQLGDVTAVLSAWTRRASNTPGRTGYFGDK